MVTHDNRQRSSVSESTVRRPHENIRCSQVSTHYSEDKREVSDVKHANNFPNNSDEITQRRVYSTNDFRSILSKTFGGKLDNDKLIIIALIFLLIKEGADIKLVIALAYILL